MNGLINAIRNGTVADVRFEIMRNSALLDAADAEGKTAIIHAVLQGDQAKVKSILDYGASVSVCDAAGKNALDYAEGGVRIVLKNHLDNLANLRKVQLAQQNNLRQALKSQNKHDKIVFIAAPLVMLILPFIFYALYWPLHDGIVNGYFEYCSAGSCTRYAFSSDIVSYALFVLLTGVALVIIVLLFIAALATMIKVIKRKVNGTSTPLIESMERSLNSLERRLEPHNREN